MTSVLSRPAAAAPPTPPAARRRSLIQLGSTPVYAWILVLILVPNLLLLVYSFWLATDITVVRTFTLHNYDAVFATRTYTRLLGRTLTVSVAVALIATLIAFPLAFVISQRLKRAKLLAVMLVVVPLWISLLIRVFAWKIILGDSGILNSALQYVGLIDAPIGFLLYSRFTVFLTLTYVTIPYVFVSIYTSLERVPGSVLEASADLGASGVRRFLTVTWPLARQGAAIGFTLAFVLSVGDYLTPSLVGGLNGTMIGSVIISQFGVVNNWPLGAALAIVLLVAVVIVAAVVARVGRSRGTIDADAGQGLLVDAVYTSSLVRGLRTAGAYGYLAVVYAFLYLPLLCIALFSVNDSSVQTPPLKGWTLKWYAALGGSTDLISAAELSLLIALGSVLISAVVGTGFALIFAYRRPRAAGLLQGALMIPFLLPGVILGLSLAIVFKVVGLPFGTATVMVGHATFITPVLMGVVVSRLRQLDPSIVHASMDLGAGPVDTFVHVIAPQLRTALIGGCLLGFTLSFDEVLVTFFLVGDQQTLPIYVYNQLRFGFTPTINALFTLIAVVSVTLLVTGLWMVRRSGSSEGGSVQPLGGAL